jgi:hypothetical protein
LPELDFVVVAVVAVVGFVFNAGDGPGSEDFSGALNLLSNEPQKSSSFGFSDCFVASDAHVSPELVFVAVVGFVFNTADASAFEPSK